MVNEVAVAYEKNNTLYFRLLKLDSASETGYVWDTSANDFVDWDDADIGNYDIVLDDTVGSPTENDHTGLYFGSIPNHTNMTAGRYAILIYAQLGASPAVDDELIESHSLVWTGKGEVTAEKVLANKAIQNKSTGAIDYYDDDGETVILTHIPADAESTITRTLS